MLVLIICILLTGCKNPFDWGPYDLDFNMNIINTIWTLGVTVTLIFQCRMNAKLISRIWDLEMTVDRIRHIIKENE